MPSPTITFIHGFRGHEEDNGLHGAQKYTAPKQRKTAPKQLWGRVSEIMTQDIVSHLSDTYHQSHTSIPAVGKSQNSISQALLLTFSLTWLEQSPRGRTFSELRILQLSLQT